MLLDWGKYSEVASRFQHKARAQDRDDLNHDIVLRLAEVAQNNGHKPFTEATMYRVASFVVMEYWRSEKRNGKVVSLNTEIDNGEGDTVELIDTVADDSAIDLEAWLDARFWLSGCPRRLVEVAHKIARGYALEVADRKYLWKCRRREQKRLAVGVTI